MKYLTISFIIEIFFKLTVIVFMGVQIWTNKEFYKIAKTNSKDISNLKKKAIDHEFALKCVFNLLDEPYEKNTQSKEVKK